MKITRKQLRKLINEYGQADEREVPAQFTNMCMESLDVLIGEGNAQGMSFPDIIGEIQRCLEDLASQGW